MADIALIPYHHHIQKRVLITDFVAFFFLSLGGVGRAYQVKRDRDPDEPAISFFLFSWTGGVGTNHFWFVRSSRRTMVGLEASW